MNIEDILNKLPKKLQIEILENDTQKPWTQSEKSKKQKILLEEIQKYSQQGKRTDLETSSKDLDKVRHGSYEIVGNLTKESHETVRKRQHVFDAIEKNPELFKNLKKNLDSGKTSLDYGYGMVQREENRKKPTPSLPSGEFNLIYVDFAWDYNLLLSGAPNYKTMTLDEIKKEFPKLPLAKDSIVFMWATNPKLKEAVDLMSFYELEYKTNIVWVKMKDNKVKSGTGHYVRGAHELLLIGVRGSPGVPFESDRIPSVVFAEPTGHSSKPLEFIEIIQKLFPRTKKLEMFARGKKDPIYDSSWTRYGNQSED
ncbi:MAG: MT-A70 family methyltransferase [Candidatus Nitrosopumilus sp. bin_68KS]